MPNPWYALIKNVKRLMEDRGWNQAQLARELRWPAPHVSNILTAKNEPGLRRVSELAAVFGVSPAELFVDHEEASIPPSLESQLQKQIRLEELEAKTRQLERLVAAQDAEIEALKAKQDPLLEKFRMLIEMDRQVAERIADQVISKQMPAAKKSKDTA